MPPKYQTDRNPNFDDTSHTQTATKRRSAHKHERYDHPVFRENDNILVEVLWVQNEEELWDMCTIWETPNGGHAANIERNRIETNDMTSDGAEKMIVGGSDYYRFPSKGKYLQAYNAITEWFNRKISTSELAKLLDHIDHATSRIAYDYLDIDGSPETHEFADDTSWISGES